MRLGHVRDIDSRPDPRGGAIGTRLEVRGSDSGGSCDVEHNTPRRPLLGGRAWSQVSRRFDSRRLNPIMTSASWSEGRAQRCAMPISAPTTFGPPSNAWRAVNLRVELAVGGTGTKTGTAENG
jgi:hypothetical protein